MMLSYLVSYYKMFPIKQAKHIQYNMNIYSTATKLNALYSCLWSLKSFPALHQKRIQIICTAPNIITQIVNGLQPEVNCAWGKYTMCCVYTGTMKLREPHGFTHNLREPHGFRVAYIPTISTILIHKFEFKWLFHRDLFHCEISTVQYSTVQYRH